MTDTSLPIVVVDDAKFSGAIVERTLKKAGYTNIRVASHPTQALEILKNEPARLLIADWMMPDMDGLTLAQHIRIMDQEKQHFTYILLLTGKESPEALSHAFSHGVDDFIYKSDMHQQLIPRVSAAARTTNMLNLLMRNNTTLKKNVQVLERCNHTDLLTGLGNKRLALRTLTNAIKQVESRQGAVCCITFNIDNIEEIEQHHKGPIAQEMIKGAAQRLQNLVRPMDVVTRLSKNQFAVITLQSNIEDCSTQAFKRIYDGIANKPYPTPAGYLTLSISASLISAERVGNMPSAQQLLNSSLSNLEFARDKNGIYGTQWHSQGQTFQSERQSIAAS
ncbi:GGDEF domain-containing response regulator [Litoribrevibacter albus]|uniref:Transcriptional regulator n=1 Tax=Litoribrevibacter albus TaxID=1473156 RepID=A0AA37S5L4_9GAMM|nr:response regulator [Litoribrevibacter albus]GLQ29706.1 transcriptional regulator [Litoribrevibacter albus]